MPKTRLQREGYDFEKVKDPLYFLDMRERKYVRVDERVYQDIMNGNMQL